MKKQFLTLGKTLNKADQKQIFGGSDPSLEGGCTVTCSSGSEYSVPNCDSAPNGACHSTGWKICTCVY